MKETLVHKLYFICILIFASMILSTVVLADSLSDAVKSGDIMEVKSLIAKGIDVNKEGVYGSSALHGAVIKGHYEIATLLIANGADVNARDKKYKSTPLHLAAHFGNEKIVQLLLDNGSNMILKDKDGDIPRDAALANNHYMIAKLLEKQMGKLGQQTKYTTADMKAEGCNFDDKEDGLFRIVFKILCWLDY